MTDISSLPYALEPDHAQRDDYLDDPTDERRGEWSRIQTMRQNARRAFEELSEPREQKPAISPVGAYCRYIFHETVRVNYCGEDITVLVEGHEDRGAVVLTVHAGNRHLPPSNGEIERAVVEVFQRVVVEVAECDS